MTTVHQAIGQIITKMEGIGKNQRNKEQGYNFRGIDDVLKVLHPLLGEHGVFFAPDVIEREVEERTSKSGTKGTCTYLHVRYTVFGPDGDSFELSTWGEGLDYGDKATNKAMTAAFKYALFEVFAVSDPEEDGDHHTPEETVATVRREPPQRPVAARAETVAANPNLISEKQIKLVSVLFTKKGLPPDRESRHAYANLVIGHEVASVKELTKAEASKLIDALNAEPELDADQAEF